MGRETIALVAAVVVLVGRPMILTVPLGACNVLWFMLIVIKGRRR